MVLQPQKKSRSGSKTGSRAQRQDKKLGSLGGTLVKVPVATPQVSVATFKRQNPDFSGHLMLLLPSF